MKDPNTITRIKRERNQLPLQGRAGRTNFLTHERHEVRRLLMTGGTHRIVELWREYRADPAAAELFYDMSGEDWPISLMEMAVDERR